MSTTADKLLELARAQIGVKESPPNSNKVKYNTAYYGREVSGSAYPWCVTFVWWLFGQLGAAKLFYGGGKTASSSTLYRYHAESGQAVTDGKYKPGDVIYFLFDDSGHTGVCESFDGTNITTIDGNTGTASEANGGAVMRRKRHKQYIKGAWRPRYEEDDGMSYEQFKEYMGRYETELAAQVPPWGKEEWEAAKDKGIVDGSRPMSPMTRLEYGVSELRRLEGK